MAVLVIMVCLELCVLLHLKSLFLFILSWPLSQPSTPHSANTTTTAQRDKPQADSVRSLNCYLLSEADIN
ncbi:hypothetical protein Bca101_014318 [Brassica carinata]